MNKIFLFLLFFFVSNQLLAQSASFSQTEYCQENLFGKRKNLENRLLKKNLAIKDDFEYLSIEVLLYLYNFIEYVSPEKMIKAEVSEKKIKNQKWIEPKWNNLVEQDLFDFNENNFCSKKQNLYNHLTMASIELPQLLFGKLFDQNELVNILTRILKVKLISDTNLKTFNRDQELKTYHLIRILSDLSFIPIQIIEKLNLKYLIVLKEGYQQNDGLKVSFDPINRSLIFTESYFNLDSQIYENKELLHAIGKALWSGLDAKLKNKFIDLGWINKNDHFYYKKNIGFINEDARKNLESDFVEHFYYYFFNGFFLRQSAPVKYLFFKNNFFKGYFYKSEIEKFEESKRKDNSIKNSFDYQIDPVNDSVLKYVFIIKSSMIKSDLKIKNIFLNWKDEKLKAWELSNAFFVSQNRISLRGVLNKRDIDFHQINDPIVTLQLENGQNIEISGFKQSIKLFDNIIAKKMNLSEFISIKLEDDQMHLNIKNSAIENVNLVWQTNDNNKITHYWDKQLHFSMKFPIQLKVHPFWGSQKLKLVEAYLNKQKYEVDGLDWNVSSSEIKKFTLIDSGVIKDKNNNKYKFIFKNIPDLIFNVGVYVKRDGKVSYVVFDELVKLVEKSGIKVEIKKNIDHFVLWLEVAHQDNELLRVEFISKFPYIESTNFLYNSNQEYREILEI